VSIEKEGASHENSRYDARFESERLDGTQRRRRRIDDPGITNGDAFDSYARTRHHADELQGRVTRIDDETFEAQQRGKDGHAENPFVYIDFEMFEIAQRTESRSHVFLKHIGTEMVSEHI
jgi:hypothetical protein